MTLQSATVPQPGCTLEQSTTVLSCQRQVSAQMSAKASRSMVSLAGAGHFKQNISKATSAASCWEISIRKESDLRCCHDSQASQAHRDSMALPAWGSATRGNRWCSDFQFLILHRLRSSKALGLLLRQEGGLEILKKLFFWSPAVVQQSRQGTICLEQLSVMHGYGTSTGSFFSGSYRIFSLKGKLRSSFHCRT